MFELVRLFLLALLISMGVAFAGGMTAGSMLWYCERWIKYKAAKNGSH